MATPTKNDFQTYSFDTPQEERSAQIFTESNIYFIRNLLAERLIERANLRYTPDNPNWTQQEAGLFGEIQAYQFLLDCHNRQMTSLQEETEVPSVQVSSSF